MNNNIIKKEIEEKLIKQVKETRYKHVKSVQSFANELIKSHKIRNQNIIENIEIAILSHDLYRDLSKEQLLNLADKYGIIPNEIEQTSPILLHGKIAAEYIRKKYNANQSTYRAVYFHTGGNVNLDIIGKILIISDNLERKRDFKNVSSLREVSFKNLEEGFYEVIKNKMKYALIKNLPILKETYILYNKLRGEKDV
ncbi:bis(5'-nucleosyl)-tetraphosphatase (symmetrical) YqeK [Geotoga petraea]|uniref:HD domain-containing protein n=1 Tax=Geotoga petraea TaxID=28234 RepID=A0A1G6JK14_9BACT|nr:bis(5'-nucleosyl)-tetraphosphatase (symmetrical) YqeK [Geotoga petraea]MDK2945385.1 hypothetical protein [Geotoga sp.]TGG88242.1 HD domain-containing protein [Geotoga petraea]SDC19021.1 putative HD superfamily hydrolase of NAD metabolism [Geotoga petraea]